MLRTALGHHSPTSTPLDRLNPTREISNGRDAECKQGILCAALLPARADCGGLGEGDLSVHRGSNGLVGGCAPARDIKARQIDAFASVLRASWSFLRAQDYREVSGELTWMAPARIRQVLRTVAIAVAAGNRRDLRPEKRRLSPDGRYDHVVLIAHRNAAQAAGNRRADSCCHSAPRSTAAGRNSPLAWPAGTSG